MSSLIKFANRLQDLLMLSRHIDFLGPVALRLYLAPILLAAGFHKLHGFEDVVAWFGNEEWGLGLPFPYFMAASATALEIVGGFALVLGVAVRWFSIPLMVTMLVAMSAAHWENGWFAIAPSNPSTSMAGILEKVHFPGATESLANSIEVGERLSAAKSLLREHGNYDWLSAKGGFVVLNNGIEFAATYFIMLLVLLFTGAGRYLSLDYWIARKFRQTS